MDTALPAPFDFPGADLAPEVLEAALAQQKTLKLNFYAISDRSVVVLRAERIPQGQPGAAPEPAPAPPAEAAPVPVAEAAEAVAAPQM